MSKLLVLVAVSAWTAAAATDTSFPDGAAGLAAFQATVKVVPEAVWLVLLGFGLLALATRFRRAPRTPAGGRSSRHAHRNAGADDLHRPKYRDDAFE